MVEHPMRQQRVTGTSNSGPFMPEVASLFPQHAVIDRTAINGWLDANFRKAIHDTKRKKVGLAGLWTEVCVLFPTLEMLKEASGKGIAAHGAHRQGRDTYRPVLSARDDSPARASMIPSMSSRWFMSHSQSQAIGSLSL
jgi:hypothetical protein